MLTHIHPHTYTHIPHILIYLHPANTAYTSHNTHILSMHTVTYTPYIHIHSHTYYTQHKHAKYCTETHQCASNKVSEVRASEAMWVTRMLALSLVPPGLLSPLLLGPPTLLHVGSDLTSGVVCVWEGNIDESRTVKEPSQSSGPPRPLWGLSKYARQTGNRYRGV